MNRAARCALGTGLLIACGTVGAFAADGVAAPDAKSPAPAASRPEGTLEFLLRQQGRQRAHAPAANAAAVQASAAPSALRADQPAIAVAPPAQSETARAKNSVSRVAPVAAALPTAADSTNAPARVNALDRDAPAIANGDPQR